MRKFLFIVVALGLVILFSIVQSDALLPVVTHAAPLSARNLPPNGQILLFIGQDSDTIANYAAALGPNDPQVQGVTLYTNILVGGDPPPLAGLYNSVDYGAGPQDFQRTLNQFPNAALAVGLYLSDSSSGCYNQPLRAILGRTQDSDITQDLVNQYRSYVDELINYLKNTGRPVFLRVAYEVDGPWNCYNADYIKQVFQYFKQRIDALGANNVALVWQLAAWPHDEHTDHPEWGYISSDPDHEDFWYPGDAYVDWVGLSAFYGSNYATYQWNCSSVSIPPRDLQNRILNFARAHNKPVMIAESAPQGFETGNLTASCIMQRNPVSVSASTIWNNWYADFFSWIHNNADIIRAVHYINTNWNSQSLWQCQVGAQAGSSGCPNGYWGDSRVQANTTIWNNWLNEISSSLYVGGTGGGGGTSPTPTPTPVPPTPTPTPAGGGGESQVIAQDGFESGGWNGGSGWSGSWSTSGYADVGTNNPYEGSYRARVRGTGQMTRYLNLSGVTDATLEFAWRATSFESGDQVVVEVYDGSWHTVMTVNNGQDDNVWRVQSIDLSPYAKISSFGIRFRGLMSSQYDYFLVDAVKVTGSGGGGTSPTPTPTPVPPTPTPTPGGGSSGPGYDPGAGKTLLLIGQNYLNEYQGYINGIGIAPAGASVYGDIYSGALNPDSQQLVDWLVSHYPNAYVEVGFSWKDALEQNGYPLYRTVAIEEDIVNGVWDAKIDSIAQYMKNRPSIRWLFRIDYEVSNNFHCNTDPNGWNAATQNCQYYKDAFNYIANRIRNVNGVSNVEFVYHPVRGQAQQLYPGDTYVDWIGFSAFNHDVCLSAQGFGTNPGCTGSVDASLANDIAWATARKPVIIAESAYQAPEGGWSVSSFETYLDRLFNLVENNDLRALVYINSNWPTHGWSDPWTDSRVEVNSTVKNYWLGKVNASRYIHYSGSGSGGGSSPTPTPVPATATPTPTPTGGGGGSAVDVPGVVTTNAGSFSNGQTKSWTVNITQSGYYKVLVTSTSNQNSRLIQVTMAGDSPGPLAIDAGQTLTVYINKSLNAGTQTTLSIQALSDGVSIGQVEVQRWQ